MSKLKNRLPFVILLIIHIGLILWTFSRAKEKKVLLKLLISNVGMAYLFEYFVLNIFQAYQYKPKIFKDKVFDNLIGAILSQGIFVPFTAVTLTFFKAGWKGKLTAVLYFQFVENLFLKLNVYRVNWWKPIYTACLLPIYFSLSDWWYHHLKQKTKLILTGTLFFAILVTHSNFFYFITMTRKLRFGWGQFKSLREHFIVSPLYSVFVSFVCTILLSKPNFRKVLGVSIFLKVLDKILSKYKIMQVCDSLYGSTIPHSLLVPLSIYFWNKVCEDEQNTTDKTSKEQRK